MTWRRVPLVFGAVALAACGWLGAGCGGGGGGGGGGPTSPPPTPPPSGISFSPDSSAGANSIHLSTGSGGSGSLFVLDVDAQSVTDLYGVGIILEYPNDLLAYSKNSESEGSFLGGGGEFDTDLQVKESSPGELTVGITRLGEVPGATGSGTLLSLEFTRRSAGSGPMEMTDRDALDSFAVVQGDVAWISGTVTVQ